MDVIIIAAVVLAAALVGAVLWMGMPKGPSLKDVQPLTTPHITTMGPQKVLQVRAKGDPNAIGRQAFGLVMKTYFRLKGVPKGGPDFKPPRARWSGAGEVSKDEWEGLYAMPVPDDAAPVLPEISGGLKVELVTWDYGEVAQVLHVGRWDKETDTIQGLLDFIHGEGYEVAGLHEEEYLRGPGMLFAGNAEKYLTLIRYPVRKR